LFDRVAKPGKKVGRPSVVYRIPDDATLCARLGVTDRGSDPLPASALRSPAAYRAALHRALIARAPGHYPRRWQAERLGVSVDSCRRYERASDITVYPVYTETRLYLPDVEKYLSDAVDLPGRFLQDDTGKRYPARPVIARMLLAHGRSVWLRQQGANYYTIDGLPAPFAESHTVPSPPPARAENQPVPAAPWAAVARKLADRNPADETTPAVDQPTLSTRRRDTAQPMPEADSDPDIARTATALYARLRGMNPERSLTQKKAEALVKQYGVPQVKRCLAILHQRRNLRNPAGFAIVFLRSENRSESERFGLFR